MRRVSKARIIQAARDLGHPDPMNVSWERFLAWHEADELMKRARKVRLPDSASEQHVIRAEFGLPIDATDEQLDEARLQRGIKEHNLPPTATKWDVLDADEVACGI
jgi:hypothetical protein